MESLEAAFDVLPVAAVVVGGDGGLTLVNARARELVGLEAGERAPEWLDAVVSRARRRGASVRETVQVSAAVGSPPAVEVNAAPVVAGDGGSVACTMEDLRDRARREEADREFITNAAHQLRTPIAAIATAVEVLQAGAKELPDSRDRFLGHIELQTERLVRLARAMLALARAERGDTGLALGVVRLRPLLASLVAEVPPAPGVAVELDCPADLAARADGPLLSEALANVLANAVGHTTAGTVRITASESDGQVVVEIADTGSGIPAAELPKIFERFRRGTVDGGVGLGLPIAKAALDAVGGSIAIESQEGSGTTACIRLPGAGFGAVASSAGDAVIP